MMPPFIFSQTGTLKEQVIEFYSFEVQNTRKINVITRRQANSKKTSHAARVFNVFQRFQLQESPEKSDHREMQERAFHSSRHRC